MWGLAPYAQGFLRFRHLGSSAHDEQQAGHFTRPAEIEFATPAKGSASPKH